jgi:hypothetical protein
MPLNGAQSPELILGLSVKAKYFQLPRDKRVWEAPAIDASELLMIKALQAVKILRLSRLQGIMGTAHPFTDYFRGFDRVEAVRRIFGGRTEQVLHDLKVEFIWTGGYMGVNSLNGNLIVCPRYLNGGDRTDIYLDVIHELVHVRQFMEGKDLFDSRYGYADRPTEIEAYRHTVEEAKRLGLTDARICEYLKTEWMSEGELERLAAAVNIICRPSGGTEESPRKRSRQAH